MNTEKIKRLLEAIRTGDALEVSVAARDAADDIAALKTASDSNSPPAVADAVAAVEGQDDDKAQR